MKSIKTLLVISMLILVVIGCKNKNYGKNPAALSTRGFIQISPGNPSYFQYSDGSPYIPIGVNMINPSGKYRDNPDSALTEIGRWMKNLSENGGNYVRVWLSESFWDIEDKEAGKYSGEKVARIDRFFAMARENNLKVKITLEHFRSVTMDENPQSWATKFVYHTSKGGPLDSVRQYLTSDAGQKLFLDKVDFYKNRYGSDTLFFGWELWNEMNAMSVPVDSVFFSWNVKMLKEVKQRFPENLVMQSLGSFDDEKIRQTYKKMMLLAGNEIAQIHRYLDPGASMDVCQKPMDIICSSAVDELISYNTGKPVLLAETGAVERSHSGPSKLYPLDTAGILLHDILFAPFFSGSAGTGMCWHWESYVDRNNLWYHYKRFSESVKGINPLTENFIANKSESGDLKVYGLNGKKNVLIWIRDKRNTWESELVDGQQPLLNSGIQLGLDKLGIKGSPGEITIYDPWLNNWNKITTDGVKIALPGFKRSLVIRIKK